MFTNVIFFIFQISKLELELEDAKQKLKDMTDHCQKEIEDKKIAEEDLLREVEKAVFENLLQ